MMPEGGRYQAATQVNVWSPEILRISEADTLHERGRQYNLCRLGEAERAALTGSEAVAWYQKVEQGTLGGSTGDS